ncbi:MAG: Uncharacterised protein [Halieaceae bacterium]|nr:MAG: Uncharacterised protein [Halieaceae bacterium]
MEESPFFLIEIRLLHHDSKCSRIYTQPAAWTTQLGRLEQHYATEITVVKQQSD